MNWHYLLNCLVKFLNLVNPALYLIVIGLWIKIALSYRDTCSIWAKISVAQDRSIKYLQQEVQRLNQMMQANPECTSACEKNDDK